MADDAAAMEEAERLAERAVEDADCVTQLRLFEQEQTYAEFIRIFRDALLAYRARARTEALEEALTVADETLERARIIKRLRALLDGDRPGRAEAAR